MRPQKPKPMKPVKRWGLVDADGDVIAMQVTGGGWASSIDIRKDARTQLTFEKRPGDRVARVLITEAVPRG